MELNVGDKFYDQAYGIGIVETISNDYIHVKFDGHTHNYENPNKEKITIPKNTIHYVYSDYYKDWVLEIESEDIFVDKEDNIQIEKPEDAKFIHMKEGYSTGEIIMVRIGMEWYPAVLAYFIGDDVCVLEEGLLNGTGVELYRDYRKIKK